MIKKVPLLLRSGDVDPNPGPCVTDLHNLSEQRNLNFTGLPTFYANARSIVSKRSKLELDIAVSRYDIREFTQRRRRRQRERQKAIGFDQQNNNFARASRFFVHFSAVVARLQRESA